MAAKILATETAGVTGSIIFVVGAIELFGKMTFCSQSS